MLPDIVPDTDCFHPGQLRHERHLICASLKRKSAGKRKEPVQGPITTRTLDTVRLSRRTLATSSTFPPLHRGLFGSGFVDPLGGKLRGGK